MSNAEPELRASINQWVSQALAESNPSGWFETLYVQAQENPEQVPWAKMEPNLCLLDWLSSQSLGQGRALVVGCGLGDDAEAIAETGVAVTAFDISETAIAWCQKRFPKSSVNYVVADLFKMDPAWHQAFDLVFSSRSVQSLPLNVRTQAIAALAAPVTLGGILLKITQTRPTEAEPDGPPWPLSNSELAQFQTFGLTEISRQQCDRNDYPTVRIEYHKPQPLVKSPITTND